MSPQKKNYYNNRHKLTVSSLNGCTKNINIKYYCKKNTNIKKMNRVAVKKKIMKIYKRGLITAGVMKLLVLRKI